jgi:hypothetical protein
MSISPEELIAINRLLIEREAAFARLHALENRVNQLLGADYPFEAPEVTLPSSIKKKLKKPKKAKKKPAKLKPRRLKDDETAYQVTWSYKGQTTTQTATELKQLLPLLEAPLPAMKLLEIATVGIEGEPVEILHQS